MRSVFVVCVFVLSACSGVQAPPVVNFNVGANSSSKTDLTLTQNDPENSNGEKGSSEASTNTSSRSKHQQGTVVATFDKPFSDSNSGIFIGVKEITGDFQASFILSVPGKEGQLIERASPGWELFVAGLSGTVKIRLVDVNIITSTVSFVVSK